MTMVWTDQFDKINFDLALRYMEQHPDECPQSSLSIILGKIKSKCTLELLTAVSDSDEIQGKT